MARILIDLAQYKDGASFRGLSETLYLFEINLPDKPIARTDNVFIQAGKRTFKVRKYRQLNDVPRFEFTAELLQ